MLKNGLIFLLFFLKFKDTVLCKNNAVAYFRPGYRQWTDVLLKS